MTPVEFHSPSWTVNLGGVFQDANLCVPAGSLSPVPFWFGNTTSWCVLTLAESNIVCRALKKCFASENLSLILTEVWAEWMQPKHSTKVPLQTGALSVRAQWHSRGLNKALMVLLLHYAAISGSSWCVPGRKSESIFSSFLYEYVPLFHPVEKRLLCWWLCNSPLFSWMLGKRMNVSETWISF